MDRKITPPKMAIHLLKFFLKDELLEEVMGDLEESYSKKLEKGSRFSATLSYWLQVLNYFRPFAIKNYSYTINPLMMYQHSFIISLRKFSRNKVSFLINLFGLTSGLATLILIFLWVNNELSMDKFHQNDDQLYQVFLNHEESGSLRTGPDVPGQLADALESEVPEIQMAVEDTNPQWFENNFTLNVSEEKVKGLGKFSGPEYFPAI